jgi:hypothetical protein
MASSPPCLKEARYRNTNAVTERRFPPPWTIEDIGAAFVVKDSTGQQLAYVYFEDEPENLARVDLRQ